MDPKPPEIFLLVANRADNLCCAQTEINPLLLALGDPLAVVVSIRTVLRLKS